MNHAQPAPYVALVMSLPIIWTIWIYRPVPFNWASASIRYASESLLLVLDSPPRPDEVIGHTPTEYVSC